MAFNPVIRGNHLLEPSPLEQQFLQKVSAFEQHHALTFPPSTGGQRAKPSHQRITTTADQKVGDHSKTIRNWSVYGLSIPYAT